MFLHNSQRKLVSCLRSSITIGRLTRKQSEYSISSTRLTRKSHLSTNSRRYESSCALGVEEYYDLPFEDSSIFPSIIIRSRGKVEPQGSFAEAQAQFLEPDFDEVEVLSRKLKEAKIGVVAHYYMDVELQGTLEAVRRRNENGKVSNVAIADSLAMGDHAVKMCENGATSIVCLGVDFMAESVAAILNRNGFGDIPVYRATEKSIGCSLAASAENDTYKAWLLKAREVENSLHVIYINTSLETKAISSSIVPTITCTSSNVLRTILQASAQVGPELKLFYGPDTYMGLNLVTFFDYLLKYGGWSDERIATELHPYHNRRTIKNLRDNINVFPNGNCVVHHMFGAEVVDTVRNYYDDCYVTAHLEVPGEMFQIAMQKSINDQGVVGSTSDILKFISAKVASAAKSPHKNNWQKLKFVLGTEAGMVTSIVRSVQDILHQNNAHNIEAEIIFPVASDAFTPVHSDDDLVLVPGVNAGEGCSTSGGCATCPFMKMNDLERLSDIADKILDPSPSNQIQLKGHLPPNRIQGKFIGNQSLTDLAVEPIVYMRQFMQDNSLPEELVQKIESQS